MTRKLLSFAMVAGALSLCALGAACTSTDEAKAAADAIDAQNADAVSRALDATLDGEIASLERSLPEAATPLPRGPLIRPAPPP